MDGGATALAPIDSGKYESGLGKSKGSGKENQNTPQRYPVRRAAHVCLDTAQFVRDGMTK